MEEYIYAIIIIFLLHWYFNVQSQNKCIIIEKYDPNITIKKFIIDDFTAETILDDTKKGQKKYKIIH